MIFKNKYGELRSGWSLALAGIAIFLSQALLGIVMSAALVASRASSGAIDPSEITSAATELIGLWWINAVVYILMIALLFLLFYLIYKRKPTEMGLYTQGWLTHLLLGGLFGIVSIGLAVAVLVVSGAARIENVNWAGVSEPGFYQGFILFVMVGFFEEIFSRGYIMTALKTTRNKWIIVLLPCVLFGLMHLGNPNVSVFGVVNIALVGILFAYLFIRTGRLWAPIGFHITWNFFQGNVFGIAVSGTERSALMDTRFVGPEWLTGGAFGAEGGAACTIIILLGIAYIRFCVKKSDEYWSLDCIDTSPSDPSSQSPPQNSAGL